MCRLSLILVRTVSDQRKLKCLDGKESLPETGVRRMGGSVKVSGLYLMSVRSSVPSGIQDHLGSNHLPLLAMFVLNLPHLPGLLLR